MPNKIKSISFSELLEFFPAIELPIAISDDITFKISKTNKAIPQIGIDKYLLEWDKDVDEFSEFIPCCQLPQIGDITSIIYWKGQLMSYEYILLTIDHNENLINKKVIAGTKSNGKTIMQSVANIDVDMVIHIATGEKNVDDKDYMPQKSKAYTMEVLPDGQIITSQDKNIWLEKSEN